MAPKILRIRGSKNINTIIDNLIGSFKILIFFSLKYKKIPLIRMKLFKIVINGINESDLEKLSDRNNSFMKRQMIIKNAMLNPTE
jgi:hypothetical protein